MNQAFVKELKNTLYVHRPLPLHREESLEAKFPDKKILRSKLLYGKEVRSIVPRADKEGTLEEKDGVITITAPLRSDHWPEGAAPDGDYANFGTASVRFTFDPQDWTGFHRVRFQVRPRIRGARVVHLNVAVENHGEIPIPDPYYREGATVFDLENNEWNDCVWEFAAMPRDAITDLVFYVFLSGHDIGADGTLVYDYRDITLEEIEHPEHEHGWEREDDKIIVSTGGYAARGRKTAITKNTRDRIFEVIRVEDGAVVLQKESTDCKNERGDFSVLDFSELEENGEFLVRIGDRKSGPFPVFEKFPKENVWKAMNFFFCERCGTPVPGKHGTCHQDIVATHNGQTITFAGGWHDAGDVSQQAAQTGEIVMALFEVAEKCDRTGEGELLYLRLMEEAQWGLDFILRTRFGDGFRASSAGATRYTDNIIGNFDDVQARVHDHSYENFLFSAIEAFAAHCLWDYDAALASNALTAAEEDYDFAVRKFAETGVEPFIFFEHTYNSGRSQYYAAAAVAASYLYREDGRKDRAKDAADWGKKLLACQETGGAGIPLKGFFYRDESHKTIVHFNHQSREYQFVQALAALCTTQPEHAALADWERGLQLYGNYLKAIMENTAPYGMIPAGIHKTDEVEDEDTFRWLHVACNYEEEKENYRQQLLAGKEVAPGYVLRNFPVWFSFRGNSAVLLAMGKAAAIVGHYFHDEKLLEIGREQIYWMWGKNPFAQSLVYGVGADYCRQYAVLCGESIGEVPVGIETAANEDVPYWPQNNNATFREVWVGAATRLLWLYAEYMRDEKYDEK